MVVQNSSLLHINKMTKKLEPQNMHTDQNNYIFSSGFAEIINNLNP